ncbi:hypothetical protein SAMN05414137_105149 [Streptacidiphilus jiangxiensis]|uniref:Uncharacterized protein n=1 Tax=Streptacidiphilus jiangxiensis TaxID=235985 RepID=A0A1H7M2U0_STRJI|nr:hypothetical protein SAMN05414137_105149 [Streptacidiphilus jiangxiensis]
MSGMTPRVRPRAAFLAAPLLLAAYGAIRLGSHHRAPSLGWTLGHVCFLLSLLAFAPVLIELSRHATRPWLGRLLLALAQVGLVGMAGQAAVDLWAGAVAADRPGMGAVYDRVDAVPGLHAWFYSAGPTDFVLGLVALAACAAYGAGPRALARWAPPVLLLGMLLGTADLDLLSAGAALVALALVAPPARARRAPADSRADSYAGCSNQASTSASSRVRTGSGASEPRTDWRASSANSSSVNPW